MWALKLAVVFNGTAITERFSISGEDAIAILGRGINQGGDQYFLQRFALNVHGAYNVTSAMQFALEHQNPLKPTLLSATAASPYPAASYSFLSISNPNVLQSALKLADEGARTG